MHLTLSGDQLRISSDDLQLFQEIKQKAIRLDLKYGHHISTDVLKNKRIDTVCPDITKLGNIKNALNQNGIKKVRIKKIVMELV